MYVLRLNKYDKNVYIYIYICVYMYMCVLCILSIIYTLKIIIELNYKTYYITIYIIPATITWH